MRSTTSTAWGDRRRRAADPTERAYHRGLTGGAAETMRAHDLLRWLRRRPFRPFRLLVSTGRTYDVLRPELMLVGSATLTLELSDAQHLSVETRREVEIALHHIVQVEEVPPAPGPAAKS